MAWQTESESPRPFLPTEFEEWADEILLNDFNMERSDVVAPQVRNLYMHLSQHEPPSCLVYTETE